MKTKRSWKEAGRGRIQRETGENGRIIYQNHSILQENQKNLHENLRNLPENWKNLLEIPGILPENHKILPENRKNLTEIPKNLTENRRNLVEIPKNLTENHEILAEVRGKQKVAAILNVMILALAPTKRSFIPATDADFDEWQKNFVSKLSRNFTLPDGTAPILRVYLSIPDEDWNDLLNRQAIWNSDFARGGKEADRRVSEVSAKKSTRKTFQKFLRDFVGEHIRKNKKASDEIKRALKITIPDTEPTEKHSTAPPIVAFANLGGGIVDVHFRRTSDQTRSSMIDGYVAELRYVIDVVLPDEPDLIPSKTTIESTKSHFKLFLGVPSESKRLRAYARWRHKRKAEFSSGWVIVGEIVIS